MMKELKTLVVLGLMTLVAASNAAQLSDTEFPVKSAVLTEVVGGRAWNHRTQVRLTQFNTADHSANLTNEPASSFLWEEKLFLGEADPTLRNFEVQGFDKDGCNSVVYKAVNEETGTELRVLDHTARICDDLKAFAWEVTLIDSSASSAERTFVGNPRIVR